MKIAYVVPSLIRSGPIKVVAALVAQLKQKHEIEIFYFKDRDDRELIDFDVPTTRITFFQRIDFDRFDIVHTHTIKADGYLFFHKGDIRKAKTVSTLHNYAFHDLRMSYGVAKGTLIAFAWNIVTFRHDQLIALSQDAQKYYQQYWLNPRIDYAYNGIESVAQPMTKAAIESDRINIGIIASAGGINYRKGIDQVVRALAHLPQKYRLYVAGKETNESHLLRQLANDLKVDDRVFFVGYVSDMEDFIERMDLFVVASRSEGFPLSLQEIVRYHKPVVCSELPVFKEIFTEDEVVFFELENIESLVAGIHQCFQNKEALSQKAYKRFVEHYTSEHMAKKYESIYKGLIHG